jgi:hypothetical protein
MSGEDHVYVGNGKMIQLPSGAVGMKVQVDLTELEIALSRDDVQESLRKWKDKTGKEHEAIGLVIWPLREGNANEYKTHSVKVDTWKPDPSKRRSHE